MDRFNFYDVYGYLLPGLVTLGLFALPFRIVAGFQLPSEWSGTFVALVVGYVVGHVLQNLASPVFLHTVNGRLYGEVLCLLDNETGMHSCLEPKPSVAGWRRRQEEASPCPREYRHRSGRARSLTSC